MKILAIDTSNHPLSIAITDDDQLIATTTLNLTKNHSIYVMPTIEKLVAIAGWQPADLDRIVVAKGPGSYTGVRIAVTTAKTLADTLQIDLVGVSSLKVIGAHVAQLQAGRPTIVIFNARRNNVFAAGYQAQQGQMNEWLAQQHMSFEDLLQLVEERQEAVSMVGEFDAQFDEQVAQSPAHSLITRLPANYAIPSAYDLAILGRSAQPVTQLDEFVPDYLRITEAEANWQKKHPGELKQSYVREV
ncbi:peptidase M22, glycoprotease [Paucilactobacillus vaccinostercus DSM 20634]|uniref:Peptidase M22, glycoprotease n=1 Tax=Paucilactobacillus vaccinostercus DSM 20634 TaxID=1423813 RepID=A0A0R2ABS3_9LACO|nr:tRNA (adenosine(37)-N6)-threonylcarbamoyltransferase complex dimerization subunit type 1 TsaB [Paucilactobacillus vaccinostercus]KRM60451.1 peptidase M22, glycoprotease [Paucilactobacillus vaccinostercus DSM 20634]